MSTIISLDGSDRSRIDDRGQTQKYITKFPGDINHVPLGAGDVLLPKSLFYENTESPDGAPTGLFNYYQIGKTGVDGNRPFSYKKSEAYGNNNMVSSEKSRNPSASNIVKLTTSSGAYLDPHSEFVGQPYNPKDFFFCKYYNILPNNRMITLRRFPTPVFDNLKVPVASALPQMGDDGKTPKEVNTPGIDKIKLAKNAINTPLAQAVTYFGDDTGNDLNTLIGFFTGMNWDTKSQKDFVDANNNDPGLYNGFSSILQSFFGDEANKFLEGASTLGGTFFETENVERRWSRTLFDELRKPNNPLSERIFVDINTVDQMMVRGRGLSGGMEDMKVVFKYNLTSASDINSKMLFLDLLANLLSIGTDYGKFLTPQVVDNPRTMGLGFPGGSEGYIKFKFDPVNWIADLIKKNISGEVASKVKTVSDKVAKYQEEIEKFRTTAEIDENGDLYKSLTALFTERMLNTIYFEPMMYSGYPTGDWHMVVGNPLNPIAMIGNLICKGIDIKFNSVLGPDDFPTEMIATYTMGHARQRHRGEFESMFNRGHGRLYLGELSETEQAQNVIIGAKTGQDFNNPNSTENIKQFSINSAARDSGSAPLGGFNQ